MTLWRRCYKTCVIVGAVVFTALALLVLIYKDDIKEISDRWHAPCLNPEPKSALKSPTEIFNLDWELVNGPHPIDELIEKSRGDSETILPPTIDGIEGTKGAAQAYRRRRGRHPPPDCNRWYEFVRDHRSLTNENLFDQIHRDIKPF
jgi:hypothetical protein